MVPGDDFDVHQEKNRKNCNGKSERKSRFPVNRRENSSRRRGKPRQQTTQSGYRLGKINK
jgi:hypothetical protein